MTPRMPLDMLTDMTLSHIPELSDISLRAPANKNDISSVDTTTTTEPDYIADYNLLTDDTTGFDLLRRAAYEDYEEGEGTSFAMIAPTPLRPRRAIPLPSPPKFHLVPEDQSQSIQRSHLAFSRDQLPLTLGDLTPIAESKTGRVSKLDSNDQENGGHILPSARRPTRTRSPRKTSPLKLHAHPNSSPRRESPRKKYVQPGQDSVVELADVSSARMEQLRMDIEMLAQNDGDEMEVEGALQVDNEKEEHKVEDETHTRNGFETAEGDSAGVVDNSNSATEDAHGDATVRDETDAQNQHGPSSVPNKPSNADPASTTSNYEPHSEYPHQKVQKHPAAKQPRGIYKSKSKIKSSTKIPLPLLPTSAICTGTKTKTGIKTVYHSRAGDKHSSAKEHTHPSHSASRAIDTDTKLERAPPSGSDSDALPVSTESDSLNHYSINPHPGPPETTAKRMIISLAARTRACDGDTKTKSNQDGSDNEDDNDDIGINDGDDSGGVGEAKPAMAGSSNNQERLVRATIGVSHFKSKPSKPVAEDLPSALKTRTTTTSTTNAAKAATISKATRAENLYGSGVIDVLPLPLPSAAPAASSNPHTASSAAALSVCQSAPGKPQILTPSPPPSPLSHGQHGPVSHLESAADHEAFWVYVPPMDVVPRYGREVDVDAGTSTSTLTTTGTGTNTTKVTFMTRHSHSPQHGHSQMVVSPMRRGMKRPSMNVDAGEVVNWDPDPARLDLAPQEDHNDGYDRGDGYGHSHGRSPQGNARPLKKSRCAGGSSSVSGKEREQGRCGHEPTLLAEPRVKGCTSTSTSTSTASAPQARTTLPPARTKYIPNPASPLPVLPSPSTSAQGPLQHLTRLREAHRKIGIGRERDGADGLVSAAVRGGARSGLAPGSRRRAPGLVWSGGQSQLRARARAAVVKNGRIPSVTSVRQRRPEAPLRNTNATDTIPPLPSTSTLTKPVAFTFRVDARLEARKADAHKLHAASEPQPNSQSHHETGAVPLYDSHHGEAWLRLRKENATATVATTAIPFVFSTEQRAKERAKFDAMVRHKEEEMARVREEARRRAEEEEEKEIREIRRRAVPKANEVPEWYAGMPKRKRVGCEGDHEG